MRFLELRLTAFGPFTDRVLDLRPGREGLHIVYGPNEAGKSSALRAIRRLLYGIPVQTGDNFLHPYPKMRIGAVIGGREGQTLAFTRRKGKTRTLYDENDREALEEQALQKFLAGVDEDRFTAMFGIGHDDLVRGGREIVEGGGLLGRLIFAAGSGVAGLRDIQAELQAEAGALFKPSAQNPKINAALGAVKTLQKELRDAELSGAQWADQDRTLRQAVKNKAVLDAKLSGLHKELDRLERIRKALPDIARRNELVEKLKALEDAVRVPADFPEKRRALQDRRQNAEKEKTQAAISIADLRREIQALAIPPGLIENAERVEQAHQDLGSHRKAMKDRRDNETRLSILRGEARDLLRGLRDDLTMEQAEVLRIKKAEAEGIRELCNQYERLSTIMETARSAAPELDRKIQALNADLARLPALQPVSGLNLVIAEVEESAPMEKQLRDERIEIDSLTRSVHNDLHRLGLTGTPPDTLDRLAAPSEETIAAFEKKTGDADQIVRDRKTEIKGVQDRLSENAREQDVLRTEQDVPTEEDLTTAREIRNRGWRIVSGRLAGRAHPEAEVQAFKQAFSGAATLETAYEKAVQTADDIADRLRREADRVSRRAGLLADARALEYRLAQARSDLAKAEEERSVLGAEWMAAWASLNLAPGTPREMMRWIAEFRNLADKAGNLRARSVRFEAHASAIEAHRRKLAQALQTHACITVEDGETLSNLIRRARGIFETGEENARRRNQLVKELAALELDREAAAFRLRECENDIERWRGQWEAAVRPLGLDGAALPAQANVMLEGLRDLFEKIKEAGTLEKRIQGIDRDAHEFAGRLNALTGAATPDLAGKPVEEMALELHRRLKQASSDLARKKTLEKQMQQEEKRLRRAESDVLEADTGLKGLCREAGCAAVEELPRVEQRAADRRALEADLANGDQRLRLLSAGAAVTEFVTEALAEDPDGINARIEGLETTIHDLTGEKSGLDQAIGTARGELARMNGDGHAADIAETIQTALGSLSADVEHFARLRIADQVLFLAIERFREKNQGPILQNASRLFSRITLGAFDGVRAAFDDSGRPVIVGERAGGGAVGVSEMSDGTADQLYLALRLAGLETYQKDGEPIPFIVDDILIRFDDERAVAALNILADLSRKTQVIFFTHHRRLVELAERHIDASVLNSLSIV